MYLKKRLEKKSKISNSKIYTITIKILILTFFSFLIFFINHMNISTAITENNNNINNNIYNNIDNSNFCSIDQDCDSLCIGGIPKCINQECITIGCLIEKNNQNNKNNEIKKETTNDLSLNSYSIFKNISQNSDNSKISKKFLDWANYKESINFSSLILLGIAITFILIILFELFKNSSLMKIALIIILVGLLISSLIIMKLKPDLINKFFYKDKNENSQYLENNQEIIANNIYDLKESSKINSNLRNIEETKIKTNNDIITITRFNFNNKYNSKNFVRENLKTTNETKIINNNIIYIYNYSNEINKNKNKETNTNLNKLNNFLTYQFIINNNLFILTGTRNNLDKITNKILNDNKEIKKFQFDIEYNSKINKSIIKFNITDLNSEILKNNISIFVKDPNYDKKYCKKINLKYICSYNSSLNLGNNIIELKLIKNNYINNSKKIEVIYKKNLNYFYDPIPPEIDINIKNNKITGTLKDSLSGIRNYEIEINNNLIIKKNKKEILNNKEEKINLDINNSIKNYLTNSQDISFNYIKILTEDYANNKKEYIKFFLTNKIPPKIEKEENNIKITDASDLKIVKFNNQEININNCYEIEPKIKKYSDKLIIEQINKKEINLEEIEKKTICPFEENTTFIVYVEDNFLNKNIVKIKI